jgi:hypothetical protein
LKKRLLLIFVFVFLSINITACKNEISTNSEKSDSYDDVAEEHKSSSEVYDDTSDSEGLSSEVSEDKSSESTTNDSSNIILSQRKIIRNADITIKVDNFEKSYTKLKNLVEPYGYIQDSNITKYERNENINNLYTSGTITLRIDQEEFDDMLDKLSDLGTRTNEQIYTEDVTDKFYDIESRLKVLKQEQTKLEKYLEDINDPDTIFKYEDKLTEIIQEIESLTGNINKLNDLVKTSTITVTLTEEYDFENNPNKPYYQELLDNLKDSSNLLIVMLAGILSIFTKLLPFIIFIGIIAFILVKIIKLIHKKKKGNIVKKETNFKNSDKKEDDLKKE